MSIARPCRILLLVILLGAAPACGLFKSADDVELADSGDADADSGDAGDASNQQTELDLALESMIEGRDWFYFIQTSIRAPAHSAGLYVAMRFEANGILQIRRGERHVGHWRVVGGAVQLTEVVPEVPFGNGPGSSGTLHPTLSADETRVVSLQFGEGPIFFYPAVTDTSAWHGVWRATESFRTPDGDVTAGIAWREDECVGGGWANTTFVELPATTGTCGIVDAGAGVRHWYIETRDESDVIQGGRAYEEPASISLPMTNDGIEWVALVLEKAL